MYVSSALWEVPRSRPPTDEEVARITATVARRVEKLLVKEGLFGEGTPADPEPLEMDDSLLDELSRQCLAIVVARRLQSKHVLECRSDLFIARQRTRVVGAISDGPLALILVAARLLQIASTKWVKRRYLAMETLLRLLFEEAAS